MTTDGPRKIAVDIGWCERNANPVPTRCEQTGSVYVTFLLADLPDDAHATPPVPPNVTPQVGSHEEGLESGPESIPRHVPSLSQVCPKLGQSRDQVDVIRKRLKTRSIGELMSVVGGTNRAKFRDQVLAPFIDAGLVKMTIPDKSCSSKQRYRMTEKGRAVVNLEARKTNSMGKST